jgi:hypothetical protein
MTFVSKLSPEQWAEARRLRAGGATFDAIGQHFGLSSSTFSVRARKEGWPSPVVDARAGQARSAKTGARSPGTAGIRSRLALRLYNVIEFRIRMMELRMMKQLQALEDQERDPEGSVPPAPTKEERESFAALIASINQVTEMASEPAPATGGRRRTATGAINPELAALSDDIDPDALAAASEKDARRRDIAERLGKMFPPS